MNTQWTVPWQWNQRNCFHFQFHLCHFLGHSKSGLFHSNDCFFVLTLYPYTIVSCLVVMLLKKFCIIVHSLQPSQTETHWVLWTLVKNLGTISPEIRCISGSLLNLYDMREWIFQSLMLLPIVIWWFAQRMPFTWSIRELFPEVEDEPNLPNHHHNPLKFFWFLNVYAICRL
jgi:hypothetical protein